MTTINLRAVTKRSQKARGKKSVFSSIVALFALPLLLIAVWWIGSAGSTNYLSPPLATIVSEFWPTWLSGESFADTRFMRDVVPSVSRMLAGYLGAVVIGVSVGLVVGLRKRLRDFLEPILEFFRAVPPPVLVPIFMLFLGIGSEMRIVVIAVGSVWPILLNTVEGVRGIDPVLNDTAKSYRIGTWRRLRSFVLPGASPQIVTGARQALSIAIILMVISEMFAGQDGLGFSIVQFQRTFAIPEMWGGVILLGVLGVVLALIFRLLTGVILKWYYGYLQTNRGGA